MAVIDRLLDIGAALYSARRPLFSLGPGDPAAFAWAASEIDVPPRPLAIECRSGRSGTRARSMLGRFVSPLADRLPEGAREGVVELILPAGARSGPVCLLLPASGEHGFRRRRLLLARPLLAHGIGSLLLEIPFYGCRRPASAHGSVATVADLALLGRATVEEARGLLRWLADEGFEAGVAGVSMGGQLAAMAAAASQFPLAVAPCIPSRSAAGVFLDGELRRMVDWPALERAWGGQARERLRCLLERSDALRLPPPVRADAAVIVAAADDRIVPPGDAWALHRHWPGSELRVVPGGHVSAVLLRSTSFTRAIRDAFARLRKAPSERVA